MIIFFFRILAIVPDTVQVIVARFMGCFAWWMNLGNRKKVCLTNLQIAYGKPNAHIEQTKTKQQITQLAKENYIATMHGVFVMASMWMRKPGWIIPQLRIENSDAFVQLAKAYFEKKKPIFLIGYHTVYIEVIGAAMSKLELRSLASYRKNPNVQQDKASVHGRENYFDAIVASNNTRDLIREIKKHPACVWIGVDINTRTSMEFADMFSRRAATSVAVVRMARLFNTCLVGYWIKRESNGCYTIHFMVDDIIHPSSDLAKQAQRMNDLIAKAIAKAPEQYFWTHRRYKTQPPGMFSPY